MIDVPKAGVNRARPVGPRVAVTGCRSLGLARAIRGECESLRDADREDAGVASIVGPAPLLIPLGEFGEWSGLALELRDACLDPGLRERQEDDGRRPVA